ncbi:twitching motility protein PilT [Shimia biformata]|uniref:twitching motility protein PilT n=1 Tax=Shimia biformata TaxID=1294299 RepID=UPI00194F18AE|nr:twitching motility protein PilT [Shimia biformata]
MTDMNWIAFAAGFVAAAVFGFVVYGPFLGLQKRWAEGSRIDPEPPAKMPMGPMVINWIAILLLALIIGLTETTQSLGVALLAILSAAAYVANTGAWAQKSGFAIGVDVFYVIGSGVMMILAHAIL